MIPLSVYVHIPYCLQKCPYCDFNTYAQATIPEREYIAALLSELDYRASLPEWHGRSVRSIYFGGGTPSIFSPAAIRKFVAAVAGTFPLDDKIEISLEANPGMLTQDSVHGFKEAGVNRLSLGAQSFQQKTLKALGRVHSPEQIETSLEIARSVGLTNINIDLIYGAPDQTLDSLCDDLLVIGDLDPPHVSAYGLTIEKGTPFFTSYRKGILKLPPERIVVQMMERVTMELEACGLERYEISNYAKPGREAAHNLAYWNCSDYLGLGAGAHSCCKSKSEESLSYGRRWCNVALPQQYMERAVTSGTAESWHEELTPEAAMFEFFFLGLRKIEGVSLTEFTSRFGVTYEEVYGATSLPLLEEGLVLQSNDQLSLSPRGLLLADSVIEHFANPSPGRAKERLLIRSVSEPARGDLIVAVEPTVLIEPVVIEPEKATQAG